MLVDPLGKKSGDVKVPVIQNSQIARMLPFWCESSLSFDLYDKSFAWLATKDILPVLAPHWVEVPIEEEIALLDEDHVLEVSVPVLNLSDLLPNTLFSASPLAAKIVGFNGYAAKGNHRLIDNFPLADFCKVTDIAGNQYEVVINKEGKIELPEEGVGLFSIPAVLTFIFSERQVKRGQGLEDCQSQGLEKNKLYLFPPSHTSQNFTMHICVSHLDKNHKRIVDTVRKVSIEFQETMVNHKQATTKINRLHEKSPNLMSVEIDLSFDRLIDFPFPYALNVTLDQRDKAKYSLVDSKMSDLPEVTRGWMQHPVFPFVFTKYFGLSARTLTTIAKKVYTQQDLIRDYLQGDRLGFSRQRGYNDFLLRTESLSRLYTLLIDELVYQRLTKEFLLERATADRLMTLDFNQISVDFHDSVVLNQLHAEILEGQFYHFYELFSRSDSLKEFLYLNQAPLQQTDPIIQVDIVPQVSLSTYVEPLDEINPSQDQAITKGYATSTALNSAYLAAKIRQEKLSELMSASTPVNPANTNNEGAAPSAGLDAKSTDSWYNTPPRSR
ncbi:MAG: hypothetical protein AB7I18_00270 [Candidatus Berkiella sp.]